MNPLAVQYLLALCLFLNAIFSLSLGLKRNSHHSNKKTIIADEGSNAVIDCISSHHLNLESSEEPTEDTDITGTEWKKDGRPITFTDNPHYVYHDSNSSLEIKQVTPNDDGLYQCFNGIVNPNGLGGRLMHLKVKEKLKFVDPLIDKRLELNSISKIHCKTRGYFVPKLYWVKNGAVSLPEHIKQVNGTLIFNGVLSTDAGKYTCFANDSVTSISTTVNVEVGKAPKFTHTPPKQLEVALGSLVILQCEAEGDPSPIIHWDKNSQFTNFENDRVNTFSNGSLLIFGANSSDQGKYGCIAGNSKGFERAEVNLIVKQSEKSSPSEYDEEEKMTRTMMITAGAVTLYMLLVLVLLLYCRVRNAQRKSSALIDNQNESKPDISDIEMKERVALKADKADPDKQSSENVSESLRK